MGINRRDVGFAEKRSKQTPSEVEKLLNGHGALRVEGFLTHSHLRSRLLQRSELPQGRPLLELLRSVTDELALKTSMLGWAKDIGGSLGGKNGGKMTCADPWGPKMQVAD